MVLQVSTLQCFILLILNQIASIKIVDMTRMLGVDPIQIKKQLKPLCSRKFHILNKAPTKGHDVKHGQVWWTNSRCIRPLRDCTTPSITQKNDDQMLSTKIASFCTMYRAPSTSTDSVRVSANCSPQTRWGSCLKHAVGLCSRRGFLFVVFLRGLGANQVCGQWI